MGWEADVRFEWAVAVPNPPAASARTLQTHARQTVRTRCPIRIRRALRAERCQKATRALLSGVVGGELAVEKVSGMNRLPPR